MHISPSFLSVINSKIKFNLFLFFKLPAAFFSGVRVTSFSANDCTASVPYKWLTQNPFKSTYFASQAMAAELSTGVLALAYTYKNTVPVSMLVTNLEATYYKKAVGKTFFTCNQGEDIAKTIAKCVQNKSSESIKVESTGFNANGELISRFLITWSFKTKKM